MGTFVGHTDGLTHLSAKGDGRYLLSNSKDQTLKIWDVRRASDAAAASAAAAAREAPRFQWDYRWMEYPARNRLVEHPADGALRTLRGHRVLHTLIRAYWSPAGTTGQRYVYAGSADGIVRIWDVLTGQIAGKLMPNSSSRQERTVRDCSWHPFLPEMTTGGWEEWVGEVGGRSGGEKWVGEVGGQRVVNKVVNGWSMGSLAEQRSIVYKRSIEKNSHHYSPLVPVPRAVNFRGEVTTYYP